MKKILLILVMMSSLVTVGCNGVDSENIDINKHHSKNFESCVEYRIHWYTQQDITKAYFDATNKCSKHSFNNVVIQYDVVTTYGVFTESITVNLPSNGQIMNAKINCKPFGVQTINNLRIVSQE